MLRVNELLCYQPARRAFSGENIPPGMECSETIMMYILRGMENALKL
jgi:hypothetical protein